jgi:hypothetical protein
MPNKAVPATRQRRMNMPHEITKAGKFVIARARIGDEQI